MKKMTMLVAAALTCGCGQSGAAGGGGPQKTPAGAPMEVAGVRPGMSMDEARRVLEARGYKVEIEPGPNYKYLLDVAVADAKGTPRPPWDKTGGIREFTARKGSEKVSIYTPLPGPDGGIVPGVNYSVSLAGRAYADIVAEAKARYGEPVRNKSDGGLAWCSPGDDCTRSGQREPSIHLSEMKSLNHAFLSMHPGSRFEQESKAKFDAAVAAVVGKPATSF